MYEFIYEVFEFLNKFQKELPKKIFVITNDDSFEFYYVEAGVMFSSNIGFDLLYEHMLIEYGVDDHEEAIDLFKQLYLKDITEPSAVKKDNDGNNISTESKQPISIKIEVAEKLKDIDFILM